MSCEMQTNVNVKEIILVLLKIQDQLLHGGNVLPQLDSSATKHDTACPTSGCVMVGIAHENDLPNTRLDNHLGTILAWKQGNIDSRPFDIGTSLVENGIDFSMTNVEIFVQ